MRSNDLCYSEYLATNKGEGLVRGCEIARTLEMLYVLMRPGLAASYSRGHTMIHPDIAETRLKCSGKRRDLDWLTCRKGIWRVGCGTRLILDPRSRSYLESRLDVAESRLERGCEGRDTDRLAGPQAHFILGWRHRLILNPRHGCRFESPGQGRGGRGPRPPLRLAAPRPSTKENKVCRQSICRLEANHTRIG